MSIHLHHYFNQVVQVVVIGQTTWCTRIVEVILIIVQIVDLKETFHCCMLYDTDTSCV